MAISTSERNIKAQRGSELRCKGWRQEAILRMLENNLENAERPEELIGRASCRERVLPTV